MFSLAAPITCGGIRCSLVGAPRRLTDRGAAAPPPACGSPPLRSRLRKWFTPQAAADCAPEPEEQPPAAGSPPPPADAASKGSARSRLWGSVSLPAGVPTAGAVFFLAGFLKVLIMCFPYSEMAIMMYIKGRADLGLSAALKAIPLALGLAAAARVLVDRGLHERRAVRAAVVIGGVAALFLSRFLFARPRPSPLDPMFRQLNQERAAMMAEQQAMAAAPRQHLLRQPDPEVGKALQQQGRR